MAIAKRYQYKEYVLDSANFSSGPRIVSILNNQPFRQSNIISENESYSRYIPFTRTESIFYTPKNELCHVEWIAVMQIWPSLISFFNKVMWQVEREQNLTHQNSHIGYLVNSDK